LFYVSGVRDQPACHHSLLVLCEKRYCFAEAKKVAPSFWDEAAFSSKY